MPQGWNVNNAADTITFLEAPAAGVNNIKVTQYAAGAFGGTDAFALGAWSGEYGYPTEVEFFSDRLWFASSQRDKQVVWGSQIGDYSNFGKSTPIVDSDAVTFAINTRQVNTVMDLVPLDKLIVLAKGGEFLMKGGQDDVVTPSTIAIKPQSYRGTGNVQGRVVGDTAVFVQEQGQRVFDIGYRFEQDGYRPQDICVWAEHLVEGRTIARMEWMPAPWSVLWFIRDDGKMLGCTYMPEQEVVGWHQHDTDGEFLDIACLPGTTATEVHVLVARTINGVERVYLEQMTEVYAEDDRDLVFMDCAGTYDGRNTGTATVGVYTSTTFAEGEALTVIASSPTFTGASDVGDGIKLSRDVVETDVDGNETTVTYSVRLVITQYVGPNEVRAESVGAVPSALQATPLATWEFQRNSLSGLSYLEGCDVQVLADGHVINGLTVSAGALSLPFPAAVVHVGLGYRAVLRTLEVNAGDGGSMVGRKKLVDRLAVRVKRSRGLKAGVSLDRLDELPQREFEDYDDPTRTLTGAGTIPVSAEWGENNGQVYLVSDDPLPVEVLALVPKVITSD